MIKEKTIETEESFEKSFRSRVFLLLISLFFIGGMYGIWLYLQKPVLGSVRTDKASLETKADQIEKRKQYQGKYLAFSYPAIYGEKAHETLISGPIKERIFLSADSLEGRKIAIVMEERGEGGMETSPSFKMRSDKPKEYDQEPVFIGGFSGFLFKKNDQAFERTFFLHSADFVISISATSSASAEHLEQELFAVIGSLRFRE